ncbi:MAG: hypothetical protein NTW87_08810 [Planctomycetota bacterium]|nr:hypothetical protein [Planctomycetota bacterium]
MGVVTLPSASFVVVTLPSLIFSVVTLLLVSFSVVTLLLVSITVVTVFVPGAPTVPMLNPDEFAVTRLLRMAAVARIRQLEEHGSVTVYVSTLRFVLSLTVLSIVPKVSKFAPPSRLSSIVTFFALVFAPSLTC